MRCISNEFQKYIANLTATNEACVAFGNTFTFGTNLFVDMEQNVATQCVTIIPYGGTAPDTDKYKYNSAVQVRVKGASLQKAVETTQSFINILHCNTKVCASQPGKVYALQSSPINLGALEGGDYIITVSNYRIKHIKLT